MTLFQAFAFVVVLLALAYAAGRFLTRHRECPQCKVLAARNVDWNAEPTGVIEEEESDDDSDLSD